MSRSAGSDPAALDAFRRRWRLNEEQARAVRATGGPVLILAGAGTGKTRVITARIAWLLAPGRDPARVLAVTFTNKAAEEMRRRVGAAVGADRAAAVTICTFHALALRVLRADIERLGYKRNFTIYDESDQLGVIRRLLGRRAPRQARVDPRLARALISRAKSEGRDPPAGGSDDPVADLFRRYAADLRGHNAVDFDDLLLLAVRLLAEHDDVRTRWRARYGHLMIDEFQDTNGLQLRLLLLLAADPPDVCVVGDDDQSIYGWRGADISNLLEFERHFPRAKIIRLEQNYRSTGGILDLANAVIVSNPRRRPKRLWSDLGAGEPARLVGLPDEREEAQFVTAEICERRAALGARWEDFAILYRTNAQSRLFEEKLQEAAVPYRVVGGRSFFDRREVKDVLAYLGALLNPDDDIALLRVINNPPRGIGETTVAAALRESRERHTSLHRVLAAPDFLDRIGARPADAARRFLEFLERHGRALSRPGPDYPAIARRALAETGYLDHVRSCCATPAEADARGENVEEFFNWMSEHHCQGRGELRDFLDAASLDRTRDAQDPEDGRRGVTLITLHAAKGLEFAHVYLVGIEEGLLPHARSALEGGLDEERRLLYVGITRAMRTLTLSHAETRTRHGQALPSRRSRFLDTLPAELLEPVDPAGTSGQPLSPERRRRHIEEMRRILRAAAQRDAPPG